MRAQFRAHSGPSQIPVRFKPGSSQSQARLAPDSPQSQYRLKPDLLQTQVWPNGDNGRANVQLRFRCRPGPGLLQASGESDSTPHQFRPRSESTPDQVRFKPCHAQIPGSLRIQRSPIQILPTARSFAARARSDATLIRAQIQFRFNAAPTQIRRRPNLGSTQKRFSPAPI